MTSSVRPRGGRRIQAGPQSGFHSGSNNLFLKSLHIPRRGSRIGSTCGSCPVAGSSYRYTGRSISTAYTLSASRCAQTAVSSIVMPATGISGPYIVAPMGRGGVWFRLI